MYEIGYFFLAVTGCILNKLLWCEITFSTGQFCVWNLGKLALNILAAKSLAVFMSDSI